VKNDEPQKVKEEKNPGNSSKTPKKEMDSTLILILLLLGCSSSVHCYDENTLSDTDLFLEDESGSGHGGSSRFDIDSTGSGVGPEDDEDRIIGGDKKTVPSAVVTEKPANKKIDVFTKQKEGEDESSTASAGGGSFFQQPGILAAIICGAIVGLLCAILLVMFIVYRMRKKDEGSYVLEDCKRHQSYGKSKEFFA